MKKTKILFVIQKFYPSGAESLVKSLITELKNKLDIYLIALEDNKNVQESNDYEEFLKNSNVKFLVLKNGRKINKVLEMRKYILLNNIEVVHAHSLFPNMLSRMSTAFLNINVIVTYHSGSDDWKDIKVRFVEKILDYNTFKRVSVSEIPINNYRKRISKNNTVEIIKNGVLTKVEISNKEIEKLKKKINVSKNDFIMTNVGRISTQKNQEFLIDLVYSLKNDVRVNKNIKMIIIGYRENEEIYTKLVEKVKKLNLTNNVFLMGTTNNVFNFLSFSDVFVFPSLTEAHPIALIEAGLSKTPVIASNIMANTKTFDKNEIDLVPLKEDVWINSIIAVYSGEYSKCELAYKKVVENYSIESTSEKYLNLYKEAIN